MYTIQSPVKSQIVQNIRVVNAVTSQPVVGATVSGSYNGATGVHPFDSLPTDANGYTIIYTGGDFISWYSWIVSASGYIEQSALGTPPAVVQLQPVQQPPPPDGNGGGTPVIPNWATAGAIIGGVLVVVFLMLRRK